MQKVQDFQRIRADKLERTVEWLAAKINRLDLTIESLRAENARLVEKLAQHELSAPAPKGDSQ